MKRIFMTLLTCATFAAAKAQVTLEQTYNGNNGVTVVTLDGEGDKYYLWDTTAKTIKLFNPDHSLWKSVTPTIPAGYRFYLLFAPSTKLFDLDNGLEVLYSVYASPGNDRKIMIVNEDGSVIQEAPDAYYATIRKVGNAWKLLATAGYDVQVFGLPGSIPNQNTGLKPAAKEESQSTIYPNPVEESATITYKLPAGVHQATLNVYLSTGQLVKQMIVTDDFTNVIFSPGDLPSGNYIYEIAGQKQQFVIR